MTISFNGTDSWSNSNSMKSKGAAQISSMRDINPCNTFIFFIRAVYIEDRVLGDYTKGARLVVILSLPNIDRCCPIAGIPFSFYLNVPCTKLVVVAGLFIVTC
jgi:hypothetical protein